MRQRKELEKFNRDQKLHEDKDYLDRVNGEMAKQDGIKMRSSNILKNEFLFFNEQKKSDNRMQKDLDNRNKHEERYDHFPFVSGELLEKHRKDLNVQLRADFQNYLVARSQGLVGPNK